MENKETVKYKVVFKDNRVTPLLISQEMVESIIEHSDTRNLNPDKFIIGYDETEGELVMLNSYDILYIAKY